MGYGGLKMTDEYALRLAEKWAQGYVCSLRDGEAQEYHKACAVALREREERGKGCRYCSIGADMKNGEDMEIDLFDYAEGMDFSVYPNFCPMCGRPLKGAHEEENV